MKLKDLIKELQMLDTQLKTNPTVFINHCDYDENIGADWSNKELIGLDEEFNSKTNQLFFYFDIIEG